MFLLSRDTAAVTPQAGTALAGDDSGVYIRQTYGNVGRNGFHHAINE
jgi:hypothetical protein